MLVERTQQHTQDEKQTKASTQGNKQANQQTSKCAVAVFFCIIFTRLVITNYYFVIFFNNFDMLLENIHKKSHYYIGVG